MTSTGLVGASDDVPGLARGYSVRTVSSRGFADGPRLEVTAEAAASGGISRTPRPAGSGYSTIGDMARFVAALQRHQLLDAEHWKLITTPHIDVVAIADMQRRYGYTVQIQKLNGVLTVGHSGSALGVSTMLEINPDTGYVVIVLSNFDMAARNVAGHIRELIAGNVP